MAKGGGLSKLTVSFKGRTDTMEDVFGKKPLPVTGMTKAIWAYVKKHNLMSKSGK